MLKCLSAFLVLFLMSLSLSFAALDDAKMLADLQHEFGPNLTKAPYFLRFSFEKAFNIKWENSYYFERKAFLINYEAQVAADKVKQKAEARSAAEKEKELAQEKRDALREEKERLRAKEAKKKAEKQEYDNRQKDFDQLLKDQKKELQDIKRDALRH